MDKDINDDNENSEKFPTNAVPEQHLLYTCTELKNEHVEYAKSRLNETEETRNKSLRRIKRFVDGELSVFSELDDTHLLGFLRARQFNFKEACELMKKGAESVETYRCYFQKIDIDILKRVIASKVISFLPHRDAKGRAIFHLKAENWDPDYLTVEEIIFGGIIAIHRCIENPLNQVAGYVLIIDFNNVYFQQFREICSWGLFFVQNLQNSCPVSIKEVHVISSASFITWGWNTISSFLSEGFKKRITFYDASDWETLHENIPPCILPEEYGGQLGPYSCKHWASDLQTIREKFFDVLHDFFDE